MDKFFSIFGKIILVLIILGGISYGGYYLGRQTKETPRPQVVQSTNTSAQVNNESQKTEVTPTVVPSITIVAGVSKNAGLSFDQYSIITPTDWTSKKESQTLLDEKLTLTKNDYSISIFQAATGGALCLYPGDADFEGPSSKFEVFTILTTKDAKNLRRSGDKTGTAFTICQKSVDGSYQQPTSYGHISVKIPNNWTKETLNEIDAIISSLKKI